VVGWLCTVVGVLMLLVFIVPFIAQWILQTTVILYHTNIP
jgi:hypothetical protein